MATGTITKVQKYGLPQFSEDGDFDAWVHDLELWEVVTELPKKKQGPVVYLSLNSKVRQACSALTKEELNEEDGLNKLVNKLKELYGITEDQAMFNAYEKFETFHRSKTMSIGDYVNEFEQLNQKLKSFKIELPTAVLAYQLLKNADLLKATRELTRATVPSLTYDSMKKQIKAIYDQCAQSESSTDSNDIGVEQEVLYGQKFDRRRFNNWNTRGRGRGGKYFSAKRSQYNPNGPDGHPLQCHHCKSIMHFMNDCPDKNKGSKGQDEVHVQFFAKGVEQCFMEQVV